MRETMQVPPPLDILLTAAGLGANVRPDALPASTAFLNETIYDSLISDLYLKHEQRRRIALDTAVLLCATRDSERLVPANIERVGGALAECFGAYGLPVERGVPHTLRLLAVSTRGDILVPTLKDLSNRLRDEKIRRAYRDGANYGAIARRYEFTCRRFCQIFDPSENGARHVEAQAPQDRNAPHRRPEAIP
jgi:hypothetical protein